MISKTAFAAFLDELEKIASAHDFIRPEHMPGGELPVGRSVGAMKYDQAQAQKAWQTQQAATKARVAATAKPAVNPELLRQARGMGTGTAMKAVAPQPGALAKLWGGVKNVVKPVGKALTPAIAH
jgi:hypothetical protein